MQWLQQQALIETGQGFATLAEEGETHAHAEPRQMIRETRYDAGGEGGDRKEREKVEENDTIDQESQT